MEPILTIALSAHHTHTGVKTYTHTHTHTFEGLTAGEGELNLLVDDLHGDEVVFFVESAVVEEQSVPLPGGKPAETERILDHLLDLLYSLINTSRNSVTNRWNQTKIEIRCMENDIQTCRIERAEWMPTAFPALAHVSRHIF